MAVWIGRDSHRRHFLSSVSSVLLPKAMCSQSAMHNSFFFSAVQQGTSVITNHLQIEAAIHMVISTAPNVARDVPNDSTLMIFLRSNVLLEKSKYVNFVSSLLYGCYGLKWWINDELFCRTKGDNIFQANTVYTSIWKRICLLLMAKKMFKLPGI